MNPTPRKQPPQKKFTSSSSSFSKKPSSGNPKGENRSQSAFRKKYGSDASAKPNKFGGSSQFHKEKPSGGRSGFRNEEGSSEGRAPRSFAPKKFSKPYPFATSDKPKRFTSSENSQTSSGGNKRDFTRREFTPKKDFKTPYTPKQLAQPAYLSQEKSEKEITSQIVFGLHAVTEAIEQRPHKIQHLYLLKSDTNQKLHDIQKLADSKKVRVHQVPIEKLNAYCPQNHQGAVAVCHFIEPWTWEQMLKKIDKLLESNEKVHLLLPAAVEDPRNLGAMIRAALGLGVMGLILPRTGSTGVTPLVHKASAGTIEKMPFCTLNQFDQAIQDLKDRNFKMVGLDVRGKTQPKDWTGLDRLIVVAGGEDRSIPPYIKKHCDNLCALPMDSELSSYNTSIALALFLYHLRFL